MGMTRAHNNARAPNDRMRIFLSLLSPLRGGLRVLRFSREGPTKGKQPECEPSDVPLREGYTPGMLRATGGSLRESWSRATLVGGGTGGGHQQFLWRRLLRLLVTLEVGE